MKNINKIMSKIKRNLKCNRDYIYIYIYIRVVRAISVLDLPGRGQCNPRAYTRAAAAAAAAIYHANIIR